MPDNDAKMLEKLAGAIVAIQLKYRASSLSERLVLRPTVEQLLHDYVDYQVRLLKEGVITTKADLDEMTAIREQIDKAAEHQKFIAALARTIAFVATKI